VVRNLHPIGQLADRAKIWIGVFCRLLIFLIIVKAAISAKLQLTQLGETWSVAELVRVAVVCVGVHGILLLIGYLVAGRWFSHADAVAVGFAGSQKTLPVGVYLIAAHYSYAPLAIVPMLLYHVGQLVIDTYVGDKYFSRPLAHDSDIDAEIPAVSEA
jgi:sodium/bile acid cotransporter 7